MSRVCDPLNSSRRPSYDGGKAGAGVYQALINLMPRHELYIEPFLGAGAVLLKKKPAPASIAIELDGSVCQAFLRQHAGRPATSLIHGDSLQWLESAAWHWQETIDALDRVAQMRARQISRQPRRKSGASTPGAIAEKREGIPAPSLAMVDPAQALIYCDPPYLVSTRSFQARPIYKHELSEADHVQLLGILRRLPCLVMISGYWSELYSQELKGWRTSTFWTTTHRGHRRQEWVWMNFPEPKELHDYRFLGATFREREKLKRRVTRWRARLAKMPALERQALMSALKEG